MSEQRDARPTPPVEAGAAMPESSLTSMSLEEIAVDWIRRVAESPYIDKYVISTEGSQLWVQAQQQHAARYSEFPTADDEEIERRKKEWAEKEKGIFNNDPDVIEKNKFLALLLSQFDGTYQLGAIAADLPDAVEREVRMRLEAEMIATGEEVDEDRIESTVSDITDDPQLKKEIEHAVDILAPLAQMEADHIINTVVSLRRYAESVGNNQMIYINQFVGLFGIYKAGKAAAESQE